MSDSRGHRYLNPSRTAVDMAPGSTANITGASVISMGSSSRPSRMAPDVIRQELSSSLALWPEQSFSSMGPSASPTFQDVTTTTATAHNTYNANAIMQATNRDDVIVYHTVDIQAGVLAATFEVDGAQEHLVCVTKSRQPPILVCPEGQSGCRYLCVRTSPSRSDETTEGKANGTCSKRSLRRIDILYEPSCGRVIKQYLHKLARASARTTNVIDAALQRPAWFKHVSGDLGVPLQFVLDRRYKLENFLDNADRPITFGESVTKFIIIHVQGKEPFQHQVRIDQEPFTRADLLRRIAFVMSQLFRENDDDRYCDGAKQSEIVLLGCAHVSKGHLQPIFSVCNPSG